MFVTNDKTLADVEWGRVLAAVAERCLGAEGKRRALALPFAPSRVLCEAWLAEVREAYLAHERGEPMGVHGVRDVEAALARLKMSASLGPQELRDMGSTLGAARQLRRYFAHRRERMPVLARVCDSDPSLDRVEDEITDAFDVDGTLSDHASTRLRELRQEYRSARARVVSRLEELMRRYASIIQEAYWTEREGRYVLPVRTDAHERFPGIVHTTSGSGSTLFVEPRAIIPLGNRLKMLEGDVRREEDAIYARLSSLLTEHLPSVLAAVDALGHADVRAAQARLASDAKLAFVHVDDGPVMELQAARHPLLVLDGLDVIASDLSVRGGAAVVISGPNAGGKTVALKTMGLAALMMRAGMPVACADGSRMGVWEGVLTDVGDDQSLTKNLSTFSAHVKNVASILDEAGNGTLVLLDELATGTDPREGEALAAGVLDSLCQRGAAVVCTTHYEGLKALALGDRRFTNASVGFDVQTMSPTFHVAFGLPGASSALAVAKRFGIPSLVLERAERFLTREDRDFEQMVERLHNERRALDLARAAAEESRRLADDRAKRLDEEIQRLREKGQHDLTRETDQLVAAVRRAREDLRAAQARVRGKRDDKDLREASRAIDAVASKVAVGGELEPVAEMDLGLPLDPRDLRRGARVFVPRLRAEADIVDILSGGQLRVSAGSLKLSVHASEIRAARPVPRPEPSRRGRDAAPLDPPAEETALQTSDNSCDLRGLRADDAVRLAEQFLDRSLNESRRVAFLIHGHGTGALREAVRNALEGSSYVARVRPGGMNEGGDGVTVVFLR